MAKQIIPNNKRWTQPNNGDAFGEIYASYGMDFFENEGRARVSRSLVKIIDQDDDLGTGDNQFDSYAHSIITDGSRYFAIGDDVFRTGLSGQITASNNWSLDEESDVPSVGNTVSNAEYFDGNLLVADGDDIAAWGGSSWDDDWWTNTIGGTALQVGKRRFMKVGANGNLYITDDGNKVYRLPPNSTSQSESGNGTLDFSATDYEFTCMEPSASRMWIGYKSQDGNGGIIEWDMSANASTANRIHKLGAIPRCIAVWEDTPIAIMSDGRVRYFNGTQFVEYENVRLPKIYDRYEEDMIHPNGWDIIDGLPHFLIAGQKEASGTTYTENTQAPWIFPSAVYCLDPKIGLYPRFTLTNGLATEDDYSQPAVAAVGALTAFDTIDGYGTNFLCSYEVYDESKSTHAILAYMDRNNSRDNKGYVALRPVEDPSGYKNIEIVHRLLESGNRIRAFYRQYDEDSVFTEGVWFSSTQFNTTDSVTGVEAGNIAWVKHGKGAGQFLRVESVTDNGTVKEIRFKDSNTSVSQNDDTTLEFINFKYMGDITNTTLDYHTLTFPTRSKSRKMTVLLEVTQLAETKNEIDYITVET